MSLAELEKSVAGGRRRGRTSSQTGGDAASILTEAEGAIFPEERRYEPVESLPSPSINKVPEGFLTESSVFQLWQCQRWPTPVAPQASYADFVLLRVLEFCKRAGDDILERIAAGEPAFQTLCEASRKWLKRDDH